MIAASVADRLAIHDLFVRYATALDEGDVETVVDCFTENAKLERGRRLAVCPPRRVPRPRYTLDGV